MGGAITIHSSPTPPTGPLPPASPDFLASPLCPQDQCSRGEGWALEGRGLAWELSRLRGLSGPGGRHLFLSCFHGGSFLPASPDLPGLRGADPVWHPLLLPPQSPHVLPVHFWVPPVSLGVRVPHQRLRGALVVGQC